MTTLQQAYRTKCVPKTARINMPLPRECVGQEIEVIIFMREKAEPKYNADTLAAVDRVNKKVGLKKISLKEFEKMLDD